MKKSSTHPVHSLDKSMYIAISMAKVSCKLYGGTFARTVKKSFITPMHGMSYNPRYNNMSL